MHPRGIVTEVGKNFWWLVIFFSWLPGCHTDILRWCVHFVKIYWTKHQLFICFFSLYTIPHKECDIDFCSKASAFCFHYCVLSDPMEEGREREGDPTSLIAKNHWENNCLALRWGTRLILNIGSWLWILPTALGEKLLFALPMK